MSKKINICLVLLLLLVSIGAVSAVENLNETNAVSNEAIYDAVEVSSDVNINNNSNDVLTVEDSQNQLESSSHTITDANYNQYFDLKGNLVSSKVNEGDTINLDGNFSSKNFIFNKKINVVGTSSNNMKNSMISLLSGASGSSISHLNIANTKAETYGIFLNSASNCVVHGCTIKNTGRASYAICVANGANHNNVTDNDLKTYGITYGHGTRSTPTLLVSGSHYNYIANNKVEVDDANGIYLSSYDGGPIKGGLSNFNVIYNNTVMCNSNVLPTSWSYTIQIMGNNNTIKANKVIRGYRGISSAGYGNIFIDNIVRNITGADYNHLGVETGGEYAIVGSYGAIVKNNTIIDCKIISTGAGITVIDNSIVENNWVNVTKAGRGIVAAGSNVVIRNNTVFTEFGSGIYEKDEGSGLLIENNVVTSDSGVGILIEKLSSRRMPSNVNIIGNTVRTGNKVAIDASGVQANTSDIDVQSNNVFGKDIHTPAGVIDTSKPTYIYKGATLTITPSNFDEYINANGGLTDLVNDGDILKFKGTFDNKVIYINKGIKITGENPIFYNSTFKVTTGNVLIENLNIINNEAERVNAWGIFVNQAQGVRIINNNISVNDPKASYAVYVLESTFVDVWNNQLTSEGDYLTFTLLSYACEDCNFANNTIKTIGTGDVYNFRPETCIDGNEIVIDGKQYCIDGNELYIDGKSYCIDGNELVIDGKSYCIDGNEIVIDGKQYCIDGNELVIDGKSYCIDGNELVIDGKSYCIDGNELVIDGKSYCIDGNELCIDGEEYCMDGAHVISEIYQTYGILLLYSSNNVVSGNNVNVTSKLAEVHSTTGKDNSTNSLVGIDLYFNSHNNVFSNNIVNVKGKDNYVYGMGVLGYNTGHKAPEGQGATNNTFESNIITLESPYFATGLIVGAESEGTILKDNVIFLNANGVTYGITLELSKMTTIEGNDVTLNSEVIYGIEALSSDGNVIIGNDFKTDAKQVYGILLSICKENIISNNIISANGNGEELTIRNLDSIKCGNAGIYLRSNSSNNRINANNITSTKGYAIIIDNEAIDNVIEDNYLNSETGIGNAAVNNTIGNEISDNYAFIANYTIKVSEIKYLGNGQFILTCGNELNGAVVKFYDLEDKFIGDATVSNGGAVYNYAFDETYTPATYRFTAQLFKENYKVSVYEMLVDINKADVSVAFENITIIQGDTQSISLKIVDPLGNPIKGATVKFNRQSARDFPMGTAVSDSQGIAKISYELPVSLGTGDYIVRADISGLSNYNDASVESKLTVSPRLDVMISINSNMYVKGILGTLKDSNGNVIGNKKVSVKLGSTTYSITSNDEGKLVLPADAKAGSYQATVNSPAEGKYSENTLASKVLIVNPISGGKNYSVYYGNTVKYKVRILDTKGKAVGAGKVVNFKVNGKTIKSKTDKSGYATASVKLGVGKYTIAATYGGVSTSNNIVFKATLSAKNMVHKKAKTIKFSTKLVDKKGKVLKGKKITFKIGGKKYSAKTNKKGVATAAIKNLKVGKFTITSSYGGCTIKNTIQIKK
ncbi:right-handed parallel beta-helix repeat-containing protein [Methanobrevibacter sp.]|uniref:right-handed parallel beta-helix repeat-containing protein n=1 Tax=Methanobrevibacter sp. TaxID=66852 RepID=UPI0038635E8C